MCSFGLKKGLDMLTTLSSILLLCFPIGQYLRIKNY